MHSSAGPDFDVENKLCTPLQPWRGHFTSLCINFSTNDVTIIASTLLCGLFPVNNVLKVGPGSQSRPIHGPLRGSRAQPVSYPLTATKAGRVQIC